MELKRAVRWALVSLTLVFVIAGVLFPPRETAAAQGAASPAPAPEPTPAPQPIPSSRDIRLLRSDGSVVRLGLEDYVAGVVRAEMPASFAPAALEAQAVAARTYALNRLAGGTHAGSGADLCDDPACCQGCALEPPAGWGSETQTYQEKVRAAVSATAGEVLLTQDGALIDAVFHASSLGRTAPAQAVWGSAVPYLVSVSTPETPETVDDLVEWKTFTLQELEALLGPGEIGEPIYEDWGGVASLPVGSKSLGGVEVRRLLGLRSARFSLERGEGSVTFVTSGYGHGVGMSQQGANLLAQQGSSYADILAHYYPGTRIERL